MDDALTPTACLESMRRRYTTFRAGSPIVLMDGATWYLADPVVRHKTLVGPGGASLEPYLWLESEIPGELDYLPLSFSQTIEKAAERGLAAGDDWGARFLAAVDPVILRLLGNYFLTFEEIHQLLDPCPERVEATMLLVMTVVTETVQTIKQFADAVRASLESVMQVKADPGASAN
jgi:hypothetical protein